jgi:hypothetical protein
LLLGVFLRIRQEHSLQPHVHSSAILTKPAFFRLAADSRQTEFVQDLNEAIKTGRLLT